MLLSYSANCQTLLKLHDSNAESYLHTFPNPYRSYQIDTSFCFSQNYAKNILYWSKLGVNSSEILSAEQNLRINLTNQVITLDNKVFELIQQVNDLSRVNITLQSEKGRLNSALGGVSIKLSEERAKNSDLKKRLQDTQIAAIVLGGLSAVLVYTLATNK